MNKSAIRNKKVLSGEEIKILSEPLDELTNCMLCPRNCAADRFSNKLGYCNNDTLYNIASICIHKGEEPVISGTKGICNIFFNSCNLQCIYCQNYQISNNKHSSNKLTLPQVIEKITDILDNGINIVGFVSPSHNISQVKIIINTLRYIGYTPTFVYNTNAYDKIESIESMEGYIDIYLPDFKYSDSRISKELSDARDYPEVALKSIKEMYHQKGSTLIVNDNHYAESGIIIRHLVLPGYVDNSINVLRTIAEEISPKIHISLMSQYSPTKNTKNHAVLNNRVSEQEYKKVVDELEQLGFNNGWVQEYESSEYYLPDFNNEHPFES